MTAPVAVRRTEAPAIGSDTVLVVSEALVGLLYWRGVPVLREVRDELTGLQRFLLEMALALGTIRAEDFEEVVSLPRSVLAGGMSRLVAGGAVRLVGGEFCVVSEVAEQFLQQEAVVRAIESTADFALFPRSGDLMVVASSRGGSWLRELELKRLLPATNAPVPRELWKERLTAYLARRLRDGTVVGHEADVVAVSSTVEERALLGRALPSKERNGGAPSTATGVCPAYRCRAEVRRDATNGYAVDAVLRGESGRRGRRPQTSDEEDETVEVAIQINGAAGLVASWLELADALDDPTTLRAAWREIGPLPGTASQRPPRADRRSSTEWAFTLSSTDAHAIAEQGRALTQPVGLAIQGEEAVVEVLCSFTPGDPDARALFARDAAAATLLTSDAPADDLDAVCREASRQAGPTAGLSAAAVRERIWRLGWYRLTYALREREDFPGD